jgi:hypothetical protein
MTNKDSGATTASIIIIIIIGSTALGGAWPPLEVS